MKKIEKLGSAKRFGSRYGKKPKQLFAEIEKLQRAKHKCPYCHYKKIKRLSFGIWNCRKCNAKFTGRAYTISETLPTEKELKPEEKTEEEIIGPERLSQSEKEEA